MKHLAIALALVIPLLPACAEQAPSTVPPASTSSVEATPGETAAIPAAPPAEPAPVWALVPDRDSSRIHWTSRITDQKTTQVKGQFTALSGGVLMKDWDLSSMTGSIGADLWEIETGIPERNETISTYLFRAKPDGQANLSVEILSVAPKKSSLGVGESTGAEVAFSLVLTTPVTKGATAVQGTTQVTIRRPDKESLAIVAEQPVSVSIEELGLAMPLNALIEVCKAKGVINDGVEVSLDLLLLPPGVRLPEKTEGQEAP